MATKVRSAKQRVEDLEARIERLRERKQATLRREAARDRAHIERQKMLYGGAVLAAQGGVLSAEEVAGALVVYLKTRTEESSKAAETLGRKALAA